MRRPEDLSEIAAYPDHDYRRSEDVLHVLRESRDVAGPRTHRGAREGVGAACVRQRGRHLGDGITQTEIHDGHYDDRNQHPAEASGREAEIPAEEIARDHGPDSHSPQLQDSGVAAELALCEILLIRRRVRRLHGIVWIVYRAIAPANSLRHLTTGAPSSSAGEPHGVPGGYTSA